MKNMIDRYLYDVSRRLPESIRADVERELRSNIEDMLPENPTEEDTERVLLSLGSPAKLSVQYHPNPRYLIPPELFDDYLMVLKIVAVTLASLLAALSVFKVVFGDLGGAGLVPMIVTVLSSFLSAAFTGIVQAFFWVTVGFFCASYFGKDKKEAHWSPKELREIPQNAKTVIKKSETIANVVFTVLFTLLFLAGTLRQPPFIAWYEAGRPIVPLLNAQVVLRFLPLYIIEMLLLIFVSALKLIKGRWTASVAISQCVSGAFSAVVGVAFFTRPDVFTGAFMARFAEKLHLAPTVLAGHIDIGVKVIVALIIIGAAADIAATIGKAVRSGQ
jgi:hypothetical protein